ncbi:MAG: hypothetical protein M1834_004231 [Cirrosporium novae-zelandiae]|nr:MAG: hypothetical protein M1834_004231 [Cirrosporium novae-zelandiae]
MRLLPKKLSTGVEGCGRTLRYCGEFGYTPNGHVAKCDVDDFEEFLDWCLTPQNSNIKQKSSLIQLWTWVRCMYIEATGKKITHDINKRMDFVIEQLAKSAGLNSQKANKPCLGVDDAILILESLWSRMNLAFSNERHRVQLSLLILIHAFTTQRPGSIVESSDYYGTNRCLCYKHVHLLLVPNPEELGRPIIIMELKLEHLKGKREEKTGPLIFVFYERDDCLVLCPIAHMLGLAFADNAFESDFIKCPEDIFKLEIPPSRRSIELKWKPEMFDIPVFRGIGHDGSVSKTRALTYNVFFHDLERIGDVAGFPMKVTPYCIRRAGGMALDETTTAALRNQAMGHGRSSVYQTYYMSSYVNADVQAAYLGVPSNKALFRAVGRMSLRSDARAPTSLTDEQKAELEQDPSLIALRNEVQSIKEAISKEYGIVTKSKGTALYKSYINAQNRYRWTRYSLNRKRKAMARQKFFDTIDTIEVDRQLATKLNQKNQTTALDSDKSDPKQVFEIQERAILVENLFQPQSQLSDRILVIQAMTGLCRRREMPGKTPGDRRTHPAKEAKMEESKNQHFNIPIILKSVQCIFCIGDTRLPIRSRTYSFSRPDAIRRHMEHSHYRHIPKTVTIECPHPECKERLTGVDHLKNHAQVVHGITS